MLSLESFIAIRHIRTRKRQTALSIFAIALAVAISMTSVSLQNGFQDLLFNIIVEDLPHVTVSPKEGDSYIHLYRNLMDFALSSKEVSVVSASLSAPATLAYKDNIENVALIGAGSREMAQIYPSIAKNVVQGDLNAIDDGRRVVLGQRLADKLKVRYGQTVGASFPDSNSMNLIVVGIYQAPQGFPEDLAIVSLSTARDFLGQGDVVSAVDIKLYNVYDADALTSRLRERGYNAQSWQQLYPEILQTLAVENVQNQIVMLLIMIIASFGIASVMYMLVLEKTGEIGMLLSMGANGRTILGIFLFESGLLGLMGGLTGTAAGLILSLYLKSLELTMESPGGVEITLPVIIKTLDIVLIVLLAVSLSIVSGLYPAFKASRLDPVEALKA